VDRAKTTFHFLSLERNVGWYAEIIEVPPLLAERAS
jgi:hypothetical protein